MPESDKKNIFVEVKGDYAGLGKAVEEARATFDAKRPATSPQPA